MGAWTPWLAGGTVAVSVLLGWCLALLTLPGVWVMLAAAALVNWLWTPGLYSWWTLGVCAAVALLGELLEVVASGVGAKKFGGSGWGATGAVVGSLAGALLGTLLIPLPVIGTIVGSVLGASGGALMAERWVKGRSWQESNKAAAGAAVGRLVATAIKLGVAVAVGLVLLAGLITGL